MENKIRDPKELAGKRIVTSFPKLAAKYFKQFEENGVETSECHYLPYFLKFVLGIKYVSGSVEAACGLVSVYFFR